MSYFRKLYEALKTCLLVSNNLYGKAISLLESPIIFVESFRVTKLAIFIADFNLVLS